MEKCAFTFYDQSMQLQPLTRFEAAYNPTEYTFSKTAQFAEHPIPGLDSPVLQFVRGQAETVSLDLFFDTSDDGMGRNATPVTKQTILPTPVSLFARQAVLRFEDGTPKDKVTLQTDWTNGGWGATVRSTFYGDVLSPGAPVIRTMRVPYSGTSTGAR